MPTKLVWCLPMTSLPANAPYRRGMNPWLIRIPLLFVSGCLLIVLSLTILVGVYQLYFLNRIIPGVSSYGLTLGGMTVEEAARALQDRFTYDDEAVFTFRDGDQFWQFTAGQLGVSFDAQGTAEAAFAIGHANSLVFNVIDQALVWLNGQSVPPTIRYEQSVAVERLKQVADEINRPPQNATFSIDGLTVTATQGQSGRLVDLLATLNRLNDTIASLGTGTQVDLVINETPPAIWDAEGAKRKAEAALSAPLTLIADASDPTAQPLGPWTAAPDQIALLLRPTLVDNGDGTKSYDVTVDMAAFRDYLDSLSPGLLVPAQNARFRFNDDTRELEVIKASVTGRELNVPQTLGRMEQAVFNMDNRTVAMAFDYVLAPYHDGVTAAELGITEMVSQATTYYTGSTEARRNNIAEAASRFDGIIIPPGGTFSFNEWLGDVSPEDGFVEGFVIVGGRTVPGVGGGVCQVSTTAFQAAFYAGFPILERHAHGYRVGYYNQGEGVGMDAAIFTPELDFRFLNDTDNALLIETSLFPNENAIQFRFYSTNPGRQVIKEGPFVENVTPAKPTIYEVNPNFMPGQSLQVDWSADGADVTVTRVILDANGNELDRDEFVSRYQPWGAIVQVAPGDTRANT